jgi:hypothetical protein
MSINFRELLPEEISDEGAYHVVNIFMDLALALESHYFAKTRRYSKNKEPLDTPAPIQDPSKDETSF